MEERLNEISLLDGSTPIDLDKFRELLQEELENEDSRKAALQGLIEEIIAHPDYTMEVKYRIGGNDPIEPTSYPHESRYAHTRLLGCLEPEPEVLWNEVENLV